MVKTKRNIVAIIVMLSLLVCFSGCKRDVFLNNTKDYADINWKPLQKLVEGGPSVFPDSDQEISCTKFLYHNEHHVWENVIQIYLCVQYNDIEFENEVNRLSTINVKQNIRYDDLEFNFPAYVAVEAYDNIYEYALLDKDSNSIHYLFFKYLNSSDAEIEKEYLPKHWNEYCHENRSSFSIYETR